MVNAITAVGTAATSGGTNITTVTVVPATLGNVLVVGTLVSSATVHFSSLSGGGCTTWTHLLGPSVLSGLAQSIDLWVGVVTAAGSATLTGTPSASVSALNTDFISQQFAGGGAGTVWAVDGAQSTTKTNTASTTMTFPTLTPGGASRLYVGFGESSIGGGSPPSAGYTLQTTANSMPLLYNVSVSTAQSPTCAMGISTTSLTQGSLITATAAPTGSPRLININQAVNRASSF